MSPSLIIAMAMILGGIGLGAAGGKVPDEKRKPVE
jgi:hypothetical protein